MEWLQLNAYYYKLPGKFIFIRLRLYLHDYRAIVGSNGAWAGAMTCGTVIPVPPDLMPPASRITPKLEAEVGGWMSELSCVPAFSFAGAPTLPMGQAQSYAAWLLHLCMIEIASILIDNVPQSIGVFQFVAFKPLLRMLRMTALNPLTGTDMLLRSMKFLLLKSLAMNNYKKGKHWCLPALGYYCFCSPNLKTHFWSEEK